MAAAGGSWKGGIFAMAGSGDGSNAGDAVLMGRDRLMSLLEEARAAGASIDTNRGGIWRLGVAQGSGIGSIEINFNNRAAKAGVPGRIGGRFLSGYGNANAYTFPNTSEAIARARAAGGTVARGYRPTVFLTSRERITLDDFNPYAE